MTGKHLDQSCHGTQDEQFLQVGRLADGFGEIQRGNDMSENDDRRNRNRRPLNAEEDRLA